MALHDVIAAAVVGAVATGAVGGMGFLIGRALNRSERRVRQDVHQDTQLALIEQRVQTLEREQARATAHLTAQGEELSALASWADQHGRWHERGEATTPPRP